tara:strand:- start:590 stop:718 length:129 start_codon:yes stop_codon:yes gene_type:complete
MLRYIPGILGAVLVVAGAALFHLALGVLALGVVLLMVDRRMS